MIYTPYLPTLRIVLPIALICAVWAHGCSYGKRTESAKTLAAQETLKAYAEETRAAEKAAREATTALQEQIKDADAEHDASLKENARLAASLATALRNGKQRLSDTWRCPTASASDAGQDAAEAASARQADSLARIVDSTAADEAAIDWIYERWQAEHRAVIAAGCAVERQ